jgi:hypothetical protein
MATGQQLQKMDDATAELRRHMDPAVKWLTDTDDSVFGTTFFSDAELSLLKNVRDEKARAEEWLTTWRRWAERGYSTSPSETYPVAFYLRVGNDIASAFALYTREQVHASAFIVGEALAATVSDLATGVEQAGGAALNVLQGAEDLTKALAAPWPIWVKAGLTLGAAGLGFFVVRALVDKVPNLSIAAHAATGAATG